MQYFSTLPLITKTDYNNKSVLVSNLLSRSYILPSLLRNITLFYEYDVKDEDTPENMAYRYYGDVYRYWLLLYSNNIIDPQSEWPLNNIQFPSYLFDKYKQDTANTLSIPVSTVKMGQVMSYLTSTVHHYEKSITTTDSSNYQSQTITTNIDKNIYDSLQESSVSATFNNNIVATVTTKKNAVSIYDYETKLNEGKREIYILNSSYVNDMEKYFKKLMGVLI